MADLTPGFVKALGLYQSIKAAAIAGRQTADIWDTLRTVAEASGQTLAGISAVDVSRLRGAAAAELQASHNLAAAEPGQAIDASMISVAPYARDPLVMDLAPRYNVTIEVSALVDGELQTRNYVVSYTGSLPPTVDALQADAAGQAASFGQQYGFEAAGSSVVSIVAV